MYLHPEMDFCYLRGNHDQCDFLSDLSDDELPENLRQFSEDQWTSYAYGDVVISGLELNRQNSRTLGMDLVLDQTKCNIVVLHGQEADYESKIRRRWCSCRLSAESISIIWPWAIFTPTKKSAWTTGESTVTAAVWRAGDLTSADRRDSFF